MFVGFVTNIRYEYVADLSMHLKVNDEFLGVDNQMGIEKFCHWKKRENSKSAKNKD